MIEIKHLTQDNEFFKKLESLKPIARCVCFNYEFKQMYQKKLEQIYLMGIGSKCGRCKPYIESLIKLSCTSY